MFSLSKNYLVDAGYANLCGFLAPYQEIGYHVKEYKGDPKQPQMAKELFNQNIHHWGIVKASFGLGLYLLVA